MGTSITISPSVNVLPKDLPSPMIVTLETFESTLRSLPNTPEFIIDDISWLPYHKKAWRNNEWIENNNKETFKKLIEIYNANQNSLKISFYFESSGLAVVEKLSNKINFTKKIPSREFSFKNIFRKLFK